MSTYSNSHFVITGKACRGCKHCEGALSWLPST